VPFVFAPATLAPIQITLLAVVTSLPAKEPNAILSLPELLESVSSPMAVFRSPAVLVKSAAVPLAVLLPPVVLLLSA
jgi:hypothetical protein